MSALTVEVPVRIFGDLCFLKDDVRPVGAERVRDGKPDDPVLDVQAEAEAEDVQERDSELGHAVTVSAVTA